MALNWPVRRDRLIALAMLAPAAILYLLYWREDGLDPLTAPALLLDRFIQVGLVVFVLALPLVALAPPVKAVAAAVLAAGIGAAFSVVVLFAGVLRGPTEGGVAALAVLALAGCVRALWTCVPLLPRGSRSGARSLAIGVVGGLAAAALSWIQFWHSTLYLPDHTDASVTQAVTVIHEGAADDHHQATVAYEVRNDTSARVFVILSRLYVCARPERPTTAEGECEEFAAVPIRERSWLSPRSTYTFRVAIEKPESEPVLTVRARVYYARGDRMRETLPRIEGRAPDREECRDIRVTRLQDASRYEALAEKPKYLAYFTWTETGRVTFLVTADSSPECDESRTDLTQHYGIAEQTVVWQGRPAKKS